MSYDDHTDCGFCHRHSADCWCYSTNLWTGDEKGDRLAWCHRPDEPAAHVPAVPWGQCLDEAYEALDQAFLDAKPIEPKARVVPGNDSPMGRILDAYKLIESAPPRRTEPIKLTEEQLAAIRAQQPERPAWESGVVADLFAVPIVKVYTIEESTPYQEAPKYATGGPIRHGDFGPFLDEGGCSYIIPNRHDPDAVPAPIVSFPRHQLSEDEWRRFERRWRWAVKEHGNALRILNSDGSHGRWLGRRPPWWKRAYYRVRRWMA